MFDWVLNYIEVLIYTSRPRKRYHSFVCLRIVLRFHVDFVSSVGDVISSNLQDPKERYVNFKCTSRNMKIFACLLFHFDLSYNYLKTAVNKHVASCLVDSLFYLFPLSL